MTGRIPFAQRKFSGKTYSHYNATDSASRRNEMVASAKRRYKSVRVLKPNSPTEGKYIIYVRGEKRRT